MRGTFALPVAITNDEHRVIFEKIAAGDGESAQRAMVEHIVGARNAFYEDIPLYCHMDD